MSISIHKGKCIVVFGIASLQQYVFQSNRLKENVGASDLAKRCLEDELQEAIEQGVVGTDAWDTYKKHKWNENKEILQPKDAVDSAQSVNIIYIGGGNAALLCKDKGVAKEVVGTWSRKVLETAPGLRVVVGYKEVECSLAKAYREALDNLTDCEEALPFGSALYSLPVVHACISTGIPASEVSTEQTRRTSGYHKPPIVNERLHQTPLQMN